MSTFTVTLEVRRTGERFTRRIRAIDERQVWDRVREMVADMPRREYAVVVGIEREGAAA